MTTIALPTHLALGSIDWANLAYILTGTAGMEDMPQLRGQDLPFTGVNGRLSANALYDSKTFDATVLVLPQDSSGVTTGTNRAQARTNLDALAAAVAASRLAPVALTRVMPDASTRTAQAKVVGYTVRDLTGAEEVFQAILKLSLPDPFFYGADVVDGPRAVTNGMTWAVVNPGTVRGYKVAFDILGPISSLQITNLGTGTLVTYGAVSGGSHLIIDSETFSLGGVGAGLDGGLDHQGDVPLMTYDPGSNLFQITCTGDSGATRVTTTLKPAFL